MSGLIETPDTPDESMSSERLESEDSQRMTGSAENKPDRRPRGCPVKRPMPLTPFPRDTLENSARILARILMTTPPPEWTYEDDEEK